MKVRFPEQLNQLWSMSIEGIPIRGHEAGRTKLQFDPTWLEFPIPNMSDRRSARLIDRVINTPRYDRFNEFAGEAMSDDWLDRPISIWATNMNRR